MLPEALARDREEEPARVRLAEKLAAWHELIAE